MKKIKNKKIKIYNQVVNHNIFNNIIQYMLIFMIIIIIMMEYRNYWNWNYKLVNIIHNNISLVILYIIN